MDVQRIDFVLSEGSVLVLLAQDLGGLSPEAFIDQWHVMKPSAQRLPDLKRDGFFFERELITDSGFVARLVVGDLTLQEEQEWVSHAQARLNLRDGKLIILCNYEWFEYDPLAQYDDNMTPDKPAEMNSWVENQYPQILRAKHGDHFGSSICVHLTPSLYRADIYSYLPDLSSEWGESYGPSDMRPDIRLEDWDSYWERTRPDEPLPDWMDGLNSAYVNFVIHLTPIDQAAFDTLLAADANEEWELRKPDICPRGLLFGSFMP